MLHVMKMKLPNSDGGSSCLMSLSSTLTLTLFGKKRPVFIFCHFLKRLHNPVANAVPFLS